MKKLYTIILVIVALLTVSGTAFADSDAEVKAKAKLDGSQEVPAVETDMTGEIEVEIEDGEMKFELEVDDNSHDIFAVHVHCAAPGSNGPVGITLFSGSFTDDDGTVAEGEITAPDAGNGCGWANMADVAAAVQRGNTYINVHTTAESGGVPSGEIRGNLPADKDFMKSLVTVALSDNSNPSDWAVIPSKSAMERKKVIFEATNISLTDARPHELVVIRTDLAPDQLPRLENGAADESQLEVIARTARLAPGETAILSLKLKKGNYVLICNIGGHYSAGMFTGFRVGDDDDDDD